jgi:hypothetical protein
MTTALGIAVDRQLRTLEATARAEVALPTDALVVGETVTAVAIVYGGLCLARIRSFQNCRSFSMAEEALGPCFACFASCFVPCDQPSDRTQTSSSAKHFPRHRSKAPHLRSARDLAADPGIGEGQVSVVEE